MLFSSAGAAQPGKPLIALWGYQLAIRGPVECRPGISLALRRDIPMARDVPEEIAPAQRSGQERQRPILDFFVWQVIGSLQLDADREVIAVAARPPGRIAGMPGAKRAGNELRERALAADQKMSGDAHIRDGFEIGMRLGVEAVGEQLDDPGPSELAGRKRYIVNDQQGDTRIGRSRVEIGRRDLRRCTHYAGSIDVEPKRRGGHRKDCGHRVLSYVAQGSTVLAS